MKQCLSIASFPSGKPGKVARCACSDKLSRDDFHHLHYHDHWTLIQHPAPALSDHHHYIMFCPGRFFRGVLCDRYKYLQSDSLNYSAGNWSLIAGGLNRDNGSSHTLTVSHLRSSSYLDTLLQFTITLADTPSQTTGVLEYRLVLVYCFIRELPSGLIWSEVLFWISSMLKGTSLQLVSCFSGSVFVCLNSPSLMDNIGFIWRQ